MRYSINIPNLGDRVKVVARCDPADLFGRLAAGLGAVVAAGSQVVALAAVWPEYDCIHRPMVA